MRARVAWVLAGLTGVFCVADVIVTAQYRPLLSEAAVAEHGFPFVNGAVLGSAVLGAVIIARYERHPVGWLLSLVGSTGAFSLLAEAYAIWVVAEGGPGSRSLAGVSGWLSALVGGQLAIGGLALMFLLAPDGQFLSRRWRNVAAVPAVGMLLCTLSVLTSNPTTFDLQSRDSGPVQGLLLSLGFLLIIVGLVASVVSMVVRLRRSQGESRQQVLPIALSVLLVAIGIACVVVVQSTNGGEQTWAASMPLFVAYQLIPVLFAIAVLRYRLYDIEVIVNRTVVVAVGTAFAGLGYTTLVVTVGGMVDRQTSGFWLSLAATVLVALAFQPLRRWVVRLANRLAYGSRAQPYEALSDFSGRLAETPSQETLLPAVADAAGRAVSARRAVASLEVPGVPTMSADWGRGDADGTDEHVVEVRTGSTRLGTIAVWIPKGRRTAAVRHPAPDGDLRPGGGRLPQRGDGEPAGGTRGRARPHHAGALRLALEDHRGGRRGTADPRGGHLARGAATPGGNARRARQCSPSRRSRVARERGRPPRGRHQRRARVAPRADPWRVPDPAGPVGRRAGAPLAPRPQRVGLGVARRRLGGRATVLAASRGGRLLLLCGGLAVGVEPRFARAERHRGRPRAGGGRSFGRLRSTCRRSGTGSGRSPGPSPPNPP